MISLHLEVMGTILSLFPLPSTFNTPWLRSMWSISRDSASLIRSPDPYKSSNSACSSALLENCPGFYPIILLFDLCLIPLGGAEMSLGCLYQ